MEFNTVMLHTHILYHYYLFDVMIKRFLSMSHNILTISNGVGGSVESSINSSIALQGDIINISKT